MEHWQKITLGTIGGVIATVIFYYFVGKILDYCYIRNKKKVFSNVAVPHRVNPKKSGKTLKIKSNEIGLLIPNEFSL
jgi:hypothetical protein